MYAVPRVAIQRGPSISVPYQGISVYHRQLTANKTFTEVFSGVPASIGMVAVALRDPASSTFANSELYKSEATPTTGFPGSHCSWAHSSSHSRPRSLT